MKQFDTMSELDILRAAKATVLSCWVRESEILEQNPCNEIAKFHMKRYWTMLEELNFEIVRLERELILT